MLQLRRPGPPRQRVQVTTPAQEVPFLPEHRPHGCQLSNQSTTVLTGFSGKTVLLERGWGGAQPLGTTSRDLWLNEESGNTEAGGKHRGQSNCFDGEMGCQIPFHLLKLLLELPQVKKISHEECCWNFLLSLFFIWCNTQEYCCIIALRTLSKCMNHCYSLGIWDCSEQCHITDYLDEFL